MDRDETRHRHDTLLYEKPVGVTATPPLVLYIVSLYDVPTSGGKRVDGDALLVHTNLGSHAAAALHGIARRVDCSRSDASTAAYLLQDWMDRL